ncbi:hypothetical protein AMAG_12085 [Allomyces macrogynus ATCC 38327]|uniref:Uncharacterized protein n=1 Tax=Allomyces macrogynus (strain ATCC 38327) TaxID=578462 RepID=A0A0L0SYP8_ALLM3|nr:hypothetical protein AMAG_12085 [Allomyces macrogynus ATCC 38327]|eukprot:KNE67632.1 hypothetical protein AMAG_12085 [Allomyces macrogynus ATCC 38327]
MPRAISARPSNQPTTTTTTTTTTQPLPAHFPRETLFSSPQKLWPRPVISNPFGSPPERESAAEARERKERDREVEERAAKARKEENELELRQLEAAFRTKVQAQRRRGEQDAEMRDRVKQDEKERRDRAVSHAVAAAREKVRKASGSGGGGTGHLDTWNKLLEAEKQTRSKYYETPRSLLLMLEEERTKNLQLETDHQALLNELEATKRAYESKIKDLHFARDCDVQALQRSLADKTDECNSLTKKLGSATTKHADDVLVWSARTEKLDGHVAKLQATLQATEARAHKQEKALLEMHAQRKALQERVNHREIELKRWMKQLKDKDHDWLQEKEARMKLEVRVLECDHVLAQRDDTIQGLQAALQRSKTDVEALTAVQAKYELLRRDAELMETKERTLREELDKALAKERKAAVDIEQLQLQQRKFLYELDLVKTREANVARERDDARQLAARQKDEIEMLLDRQSQLLSEVDGAGKRERTLNAELETVRKKYAQAKASQAETQIKVKDLQQHGANLSARVDQLTTEHGAAVQERQQLVTEVDTLRRQLKQLEAEVQETEMLLESERRAVMDLKAVTKEKSQALKDKGHDTARLEQTVSDLKQKVAEVTAKLDQERRASQIVRDSNREELERWKSKVEVLEDNLVNSEYGARKLQDKDVQLRAALDRSNATVSDLQLQVARLEAELKAQRERTTETAEQKDHELDRVRTALDQVRAEADDHAQALRQVVQERQQQVRAMNAQLDAAHGDRDELRDRIRELEMEIKVARETADKLQSSIVGKDRDYTILEMRYKATVESMRRLEDEIKLLQRLQEQTTSATVAAAAAASSTRGLGGANTSVLGSDYGLLRKSSALTRDARSSKDSLAADPRAVMSSIKRNMRHLAGGGSEDALGDLSLALTSTSWPAATASDVPAAKDWYETTISGLDEYLSVAQFDADEDDDETPRQRRPPPPPVSRKPASSGTYDDLHGMASQPGSDAENVGRAAAAARRERPRVTVNTDMQSSSRTRSRSRSPVAAGSGWSAGSQASSRPKSRVRVNVPSGSGGEGAGRAMQAWGTGDSVLDTARKRDRGDKAGARAT